MAEKTFNSEFAADFAKLMAAWDWLWAETKKANPTASDDMLYTLCSVAMSQALGLEAK